MSGTGTQLELAEAQQIAAQIIDRHISGEALVVGSVRRCRPRVGDIEICVHRRAAVELPVDVGLFTGEYRTRVGGRRDWLFWQLEHIERGFVVDLFRFDDANRGSITLIRTGPARFSREFVTALRGRGFVHDNGYVRRGGVVVPCPSETVAFELAGFAYISPEERR